MQEVTVLNDLQKISIKHNNDFQKQQDKLKEFSREIPATTTLPTATNAAGWLPRFFGSDKATSADVNKLAEAIQEGMIRQNQQIIEIIKEFEVVYNTFNSLDKEYLKGILTSYNEAAEAHNKANQSIRRLNKQQQDIKNQQQDIKNQQHAIKDIVDELKMIINVLKIFKEKLDKVRHLFDVDMIFSDAEENKMQLNSVFQLVSSQKAYIEQLSQDVDTKIIQSEQKHSRTLAELKSNVEEKTQRIEEQHKTIVSMFNDATKQLHEEMNQKFYATLSELCVASQKITWN